MGFKGFIATRRGVSIDVLPGDTQTLMRRGRPKATPVTYSGQVPLALILALAKQLTHGCCTRIAEASNV